METPPPSDDSLPAKLVRRRFLLAAIILVPLALDLGRPPEDQRTAQLLVGGILLYRQTLSPWMPFLGARCRFEPSCSRYAEAAIRRHGALLGGARAVGRWVRCGPWTADGTLDPPPF